MYIYFQFYSFAIKSTGKSWMERNGLPCAKTRLHITSTTARIVIVVGRTERSPASVFVLLIGMQFRFKCSRTAEFIL